MHHALEDGAQGACAEALAEGGGGNLVEVGEGAGADEEDVRDVDFGVVVLVPVRGDVQRHEELLALEDLEERLLNAFTPDVTGAGSGARAATTPGDLVELVDEDDAVFC